MDLPFTFSGKSMSNQTVVLPDGFNGHTATFNAVPVERDGALVKLQVAGEGNAHLIAWKRAADLEAALQIQQA
ncbi:MAG: hypothetical protein CTY39_01395 [Hyphomicrobium sp.]|nr:MAG: hypothetical protein CTY39_01395 [Hyphomicrobium sp.]